MAQLMVELCGRLADVAGDSVAVAIPDTGISITDLRAALATRYPASAEAFLATTVRACVDEMIVSDATTVLAGQSVAFFPPLSGG